MMKMNSEAKEYVKDLTEQIALQKKLIDNQDGMIKLLKDYVIFLKQNYTLKEF